MHVLKQSFVGLVLGLFLSAGCSSPRQAGSSSTATTAPAEQDLFNGKNLKGWEVTDFTNPGKVTVKNGEIHLGNGYMTGVTYKRDVPRINYEVSLDAKRTDGSDFFCGLTLPVDTNQISFIVGGWGGGVVGFSSIDGDDASQNESTKFLNFVNDRYYHIRVRVLPKKLQAWIDEDMVADVDIEDERLSIRLEVEPCVPLGIATWNTGAALRNIKLKRIVESSDR